MLHLQCIACMWIVTLKCAQPDVDMVTGCKTAITVRATCCQITYVISRNKKCTSSFLPQEETLPCRCQRLQLRLAAALTQALARPRSCSRAAACIGHAVWCIIIASQLDEGSLSNMMAKVHASNQRRSRCRPSARIGKRQCHCAMIPICDIYRLQISHTRRRTSGKVSGLCPRWRLVECANASACSSMPRREHREALLMVFALLTGHVAEPLERAEGSWILSRKLCDTSGPNVTGHAAATFCHIAEIR